MIEGAAYQFYRCPCNPSDSRFIQESTGGEHDGPLAFSVPMCAICGGLFERDGDLSQMHPGDWQEVREESGIETIHAGVKWSGIEAKVKPNE